MSEKFIETSAEKTPVPSFVEVADFIRATYGELIIIDGFLDRLAGLASDKLQIETPGEEGGQVDAGYADAFEEALQKRQSERLARWRVTTLDPMALRLLNLEIQQQLKDQFASLTLIIQESSQLRDDRIVVLKDRCEQYRKAKLVILPDGRLSLV